jgi:hypothetical protein
MLDMPYIEFLHVRHDALHWSDDQEPALEKLPEGPATMQFRW